MVRTVHVAAAAFVLVGVLAAAWRPQLARRAEWGFWGALLVLVVTGVGNLAMLGGAAGGSWGAQFAAKLALVAVLLLVSGVRVLVVALEAPARALRLAFVVSSLVVAVVVSLGLVLAHA